jgi:Ca2+-binding RTX toxin-like protein
VQGFDTGSPQEILAQTYGQDATLGKTVTGGNGGQTHRGTARDDAISGLAGNDTINAAGGNDILNGGLGNDTINGGAGRDVIRGGTGRDILSGNAGSDIFIFDAPGEGRDTIRDFSLAEGDKLGFDNLGFGRELVPGFFLPLTGIALATGATTDPNAAGFFFNTATKVLSYDADGPGMLARVELAVLNGVSSLSSSDLFIV